MQIAAAICVPVKNEWIGVQRLAAPCRLDTEHLDCWHRTTARYGQALASPTATACWAAPTVELALLERGPTRGPFRRRVRVL